MAHVPFHTVETRSSRRTGRDWFSINISFFLIVFVNRFLLPIFFSTDDDATSLIDVWSVVFSGESRAENLSQLL